MQIKQLAKFILALTLSTSVSAEEIPLANHVTTGLRYKAQVAHVKATLPARPLPRQPADPAVVALLDQLFERNGSRILIAAERSNIVYERWGTWVSKTATPLGYSMSKSLTAITVGRAICDGHIASINDPVERYVTGLAGTSWGRASVRDLLRMSSGAYPTDMSNNGHRTQEMMNTIGGAMRDGHITDNFIDIMRANDQGHAPPGDQFNYSNFDTLALGLLVEHATGEAFGRYFERTIWQLAQPQSGGAWVVNRRGQTGTYMGFSATAHDWIRIGLMVLEQLDQPTCFGQFLNQAVTRQIDSRGIANEYGYQTWVGCRAAQVDFCFVGYGGQYLLFNRQHQLVVYQHATTTRPVVYVTPRIVDRILSVK